MAGEEVHCPVCGRMVPVGTAEFVAVYGDHNYRLCSTECRQVFMDTPGRFLSKTH